MSKSDVTKVLIIGRGRLGGALSRALSSRRRPAVVPGRPRDEEERARAASLLERAHVVLLCVPDAAVAQVAALHAAAFRPGQIVAHCSGALDLTPLEPAAARGAQTGSLHPLCAVPSPRASLEGAWAAVGGGPRARRTLGALARQAGLRPFALPAENRALYHAAAAMASNGLVALAAETAGLLAQCGIEARAANRALLPLMRSALVGLEARGLPGALTGPVARGDTATVAAHLEALRSSPGGALPLYAALSEALLPLSVQLGQAPARELAAIRALLEQRPAGRKRGRRARPPRSA